MSVTITPQVGLTALFNGYGGIFWWFSLWPVYVVALIIHAWILLRLERKTPRKH